MPHDFGGSWNDLLGEKYQLHSKVAFLYIIYKNMFILLQYHLLLLLRAFTIVIFRKDEYYGDFKIPAIRRVNFQLPPNFKTTDLTLLFSYYIERTCLGVKKLLLLNSITIFI